MQVLAAAASRTRPLAAKRHVARRFSPWTQPGRVRGWAAAQASPAPRETAFEVLRLLQEQGRGGPVAAAGAPAEEEGATGEVLSSTGSLLRVALPGPVAVGQAVDVDGRLGVVLQYDRRNALVALVDGAGAAPRAGAPAEARGRLRAGAPSARSGGAAFLSVRDALGAEAVSAAAARSVLDLPAMPPPSRRRPVTHHLPSGLAAVEALLPLGRGHRVGLVGPPGTGKSTAVRMLMQSQPPDTACVYAAQKPMSQLRARFDSWDAEGAALTVVHADPRSDPVGARYLVPLCALQAALQYTATHSHVLLVLDDVVAFAQAAAELPTPPCSAPQVLATALYAGGGVADGLRERALSVAAVLDLEPEDDELPPNLRALWRGAEPAFDVRLGFNATLAARGVLPAIDVDGLLACGFAPGYQSPLLRQLRGELLQALHRSRDLGRKVELARPLGLHVEPQEEEELGSAEVARALLSHAQPRTLPELVVLLVTALVYHFPASGPPQPSAVAGFQRAVIGTVQGTYPALWDVLSGAHRLDEAEAALAVRDLAEVLLAHRLDFGLARPRL